MLCLLGAAFASLTPFQQFLRLCCVYFSSTAPYSPVFDSSSRGASRSFAQYAFPTITVRCQRRPHKLLWYVESDGGTSSWLRAFSAQPSPILWGREPTAAAGPPIQTAPRYSPAFLTLLQGMSLSIWESCSFAVCRSVRSKLEDEYFL